jgi:hypothetical protein
MKEISKLLVVLFMLASLPSAYAQNLFLEMVQSFLSRGVFDILLFILLFVTFYAVLMKSKVLGENSGINGVVAVAAALFVSLYSTFTGFSLIEPLSRFFTQATAIALAFVAALLIASFFYPDLPKVLGEHFKSPTILYILIPLAITILITSRTIWVVWAGYKAGAGGGPGLPVDLAALVVGLFIFVVILMIAATVGRGGK